MEGDISDIVEINNPGKTDDEKNKIILQLPVTKAYQYFRAALTADTWWRRLFRRSVLDSLYRKAAKCFHEAGLDLHAESCMIEAGDTSEAMVSLALGALYTDEIDVAIQVISNKELNKTNGLPILALYALNPHTYARLLYPRPQMLDEYAQRRGMLINNLNADTIRAEAEEHMARYYENIDA